MGRPRRGRPLFSRWWSRLRRYARRGLRYAPYAQILATLLAPLLTLTIVRYGGDPGGPSVTS